MNGRSVAVIGGGPAGLRAAEVIASRGVAVTVYDHKASVGRKFLVAGRGGLNLTHSDPLEKFVTRYRGGGPWDEMLRDFSPESLQTWAHGLGVKTFIGTSGRVFPENKQAAVLLRRWVSRLRGAGVQFQMHARWLGFDEVHALRFRMGESERAASASAVVLALGGGSWPQTGSDGGWVDILRRCGVPVEPLKPSNCGFEIDWPPGFPGTVEGFPLKNIAVTVAGRRIEGELLLTQYGVEGGAVYQLSSDLREMQEPLLRIDFKPAWTVEKLASRPCDQWRLSPAATALLAAYPGPITPERVKHFPLPLRGPRPLAEAISSAGGVKWDALDANLMLRNLPGVFVAGEMIDWEAPTGGYLLQGCFATGTRAGNGAAAWG